ncbi:MAG TPA: hypothetical protein VGY48_34435 [Vicinamibacterales bacterium]|jgi:hypothetical protein|nr:hypothetical protein [Vicinamibacterales bacterium]
MHLQEARLCLDCEELHTADRCPRCASDAFAFVTRWIPANERRVYVRRPPPDTQPTHSNRSRWLTGAAGGLAALAAVRWLWKAPAAPSQRPDRATSGHEDKD